MSLSRHLEMKTDLPSRARLGHGIPQWVKDGAFYFITINCARRSENQLCHPSVAEAVLAATAHNHENTFGIAA